MKYILDVQHAMHFFMKNHFRKLAYPTPKTTVIAIYINSSFFLVSNKL